MCSSDLCGRGTPFSQLNLRVSKGFRIARTARIEAIAEVFNLFNALNPGGSSSAGATGFTGRRFTGTLANKTANPDFMRPLTYAGDFQQPEQRVGQIGFRFSF